MIDFANLLVDGIPLLLVLFGLVEVIKRLGVRGSWLLFASLLLGLFLGLAYRLTLGIPQDFAGWFSAVIFGLALALVASGLYNFLDDRFPRAP